MEQQLDDGLKDFKIQTKLQIFSPVEHVNWSMQGDIPQLWAEWAKSLKLTPIGFGNVRKLKQLNQELQ